LGALDLWGQREEFAAQFIHIRPDLSIALNGIGAKWNSGTLTDPSDLFDG
jgi:hypothetical protein